jgi:hypothetical protein
VKIQAESDPTAPAVHGPRPTSEQDACIQAFATRQNMTISALAGSGKTSTLKMMSRVHPGRNGLYLAYNRAIADEAQLDFPEYVKCKTAHSLAYGWAARAWGGNALRNRLNGSRVRPQVTAEILGIKKFQEFAGIVMPAPQLGRIAMETVQRFCYTGDEQIDQWHVPGVTRIDTVEARRELARYIVPRAEQAWEDLSSPDGKLRFSHDHYLKAFCLTRPRLPYDYVLLDEGQDANGVIVDLLQRQGCQVVVVGDANQAIYRWRGAIDAMNSFDSRHDRTLTKSWRFGQAIADEANKWLELLRADLRVLPGDPDKPGEIRPLGTAAKAVLCRTNAAVVKEVLRCHQDGRSVAVVGGTDEVVAFARAAEELMKTGTTTHRDLFVFKTWAEVQEYVEESHDGGDLKTWVRLIDDYRPEGVIEAMSKTANHGLRGDGALAAEMAADVVVSTAHRAKGRQWDSVRISMDFADREPEEDENGYLPELDPDELMLAYVAVTRAQRLLDVGGLAWVERWT